MHIRKPLLSFIIFALLVSAASLAAAQETFAIDSTHSSVVFKIRHFGVSNFYGAFTSKSGTVVWDAANPAASSLEVAVDVESVNTGNDKRNQHLRSNDFFSAAQYPTINFKSTKIEKKNDGGYSITGDLTLHGVTKQITTDFTYFGEVEGGRGPKRMGGEAVFTIKRSDFGVDFMMGGLGDEVTLMVSIEAVKQ